MDRPFAAQIKPHRRVGGAIAPGTTFDAAIRERVATAGYESLRVRALVAEGGTLDIVLLDPFGTPYPSGQPTQTALTDDTEAVVDVTLHGVSWVDLVLTPPEGEGDDPVIGYLDVMLYQGPIPVPEPGP